MNEAFKDWMGEMLTAPDALACAVRRADRAIEVLSREPQIPDATVMDAVQLLAEHAHLLEQNRLAVQFLRWKFESGDVLMAQRADGAAGVVFTTGPEAPAEARECLARFCGSFD